ncbi:uncharacterized protein LOC144862123 [Branchiostoma floridae x Branchiostoma japonicum]
MLILPLPHSIGQNSCNFVFLIKDVISLHRMGAYASSFQGDAGSLVGELTDPNQPNWITAHAEACALDIPEVERLWQRFQQLGCDSTGVLAQNQALQLTQDVFIKQSLRQVPRDENGGITFQTYCNAAKWMSIAEVEDKLRGVFKLLNRGKPVDRNIMKRILSKLYEEESEETITRLADIFVTQIDAKQQGEVDEDQFIEWVKTMPFETVNALLEFSIIPPELQDTRTSASQATSRASVDELAVPVSEETLQQVASKVHNRDWVLFANKLGFTQNDLTGISKKVGKNVYQQVLEMLHTWQRRESDAATCRVLDTALRDGDFIDVANDIFF